MKRVALLTMAIFLCATFLANSEEANEDWFVAPIITKAYELSSEKLYLEWQGSAPVYQVYMDGASVASVIVNNAIIPLKKGTHSILVYPINEAKSADTKLELGLDAVGGKLGFDLAVLGIDPKKLATGNPSDPLHIDYTINPIFNASPDKLAAETDFDNRILLSFVDRYNADEYLITVKNRNDVNYVRFNSDAEEAAQFVSKANSVVTLTLDQDYLQKNGCMVPELDEKYSFTVQLRKYAINMLNGEEEQTVIHESQISNNFDYTPTAPWKIAPIITYASQTADGQITLQWSHDDNDLGCEYAVMRINKALGIKTGEEVWGNTTDNTFIVSDLMNGNYTIAVMPQYEGEKGNTSNEVSLEVKNDWVIAPTLSCEQINKNQVKLAWTASANMEIYRITVYAGSSDSLLRFVDLDYTKYTEFDIPANSGDMEYIFSYDREYNAEDGQKLKFEIYGIRHTANGAEQKSGTSSQSITIE